MEHSIELGKVVCDGDSAVRHFEDAASDAAGDMRISLHGDDNVVHLNYEQAGEQKNVDLKAENPAAALGLIVEEFVALSAIDVVLSPPMAENTD